MTANPYQFATLLSKAVRRIALGEDKTIGCVQDELGYALGRQGGTAIEYWRKGHIPAQLSDLEGLAREFMNRKALTTRKELKKFLSSADYPALTELCDELFPQMSPEEVVLRRNDAAKGQVPLDNEMKPLTRQLAPFIVGPPIIHPKQFFGRAYELRRIFGLLRRFPLQNVALIGPRRSGKTSLLHYLRQICTTPLTELRPGQANHWLPQAERYRWLFVDFGDARMRTRQGLFEHILSGLSIPVRQTTDLSTFLDLISQHLRMPAVILMDDIASGLASPELDQAFWWSLRSLGSNLTDGNLAFILTSTTLPSLLAQEHGKPSPFFNIFGHTLRLGPLKEKEAYALMKSSPLAFSEADREWIIRESGGWPSLLQILSDSRLLGLEEGAAGEEWKEEGLQRLVGSQQLLDRIG